MQPAVTPFLATHELRGCSVAPTAKNRPHHVLSSSSQDYFLSARRLARNTAMCTTAGSKRSISPGWRAGQWRPRWLRCSRGRRHFSGNRTLTGARRDQHRRVLQFHPHPTHGGAVVSARAPIPVVAARVVHARPYDLLVIVCPYCGRQHTHGAGLPHEDPREYASHRWAHCIVKTPESQKGYILSVDGHFEPVAGVAA